MLFPRKYSSIVILVVTCLLPSLSLAHDITDGKLPQKLKLTEIQRVMKDGEVNAKNHHTKIVMTGLKKMTGEFNCTLFLYKDETTDVYSYVKTIKNLDTTTEVVFEEPLKEATMEALIIKYSNGTLVDVWTGYFNITDLKARVAVVGNSDDNNNYLRVTTGGYLDTVVVDNKNNCSNETSPCYYRKKTLFITDPSTIVRCITLKSTDSKKPNETLLHCDDTYSDFIAIPENTEPTRLLLESTLHLIYMLPSVTAEVLMVDPNTGDLISNDSKGFNCTNNEKGCSIDLKIEGRQNINFIVVYDDDDYVDGSMTYPFEIFEVAMTNLTSDAAMTTWSPSGSGTFDVLITTRKDLVKPDYFCNLGCDVSDAKNGGNCEAFFVIQYEEGKEYFAIIRPKENNGNNAIGIPILFNGTIPDSIPIFTIVRTSKADIKTTVTFNSTTEPKSMKLVEITIKSAEVTNTEYFGQASETFDKYKFQSSKDIGGFDRDKHFLLIRYDKDGGIPEVAEASVTWRSSNVQLDWVGEPSAAFSALREVVSSGTTHIERKYECNDVNGTCYFLEFSYGFETLPLCTTTINEATSDNIDLCDDFKPNNPRVFNVANIIFTERKNLKVTTEDDDLTEVNLVWYVNKDDPSSETNCTFPGMATDNEISECSVTFDTSLEGDSSVLKVLLVRTDKRSGNVIESSVLLVDDLVFNATKLSEDSLMVHWTAIDNKYTATLLDLSLVVNDRNRVMTENAASVTSDIVCDEENICFVHFFDLSSSHNYSLSVQKKDDEVSKAEIKYNLTNVSDEEGKDLGMTKLIKINSTTTKIVLNDTITSGTISVVIKKLTNTDETRKLKTSSIANNTFQFNHENPIFDVANKVVFIILAQKEDTKYRGLTVLNLKDLDSNVAWVGAEHGKANASLRVDTGSQPSVNVGDKICLKGNSPCYFIEDQSLPESIERCIYLDAGSTNKRVQQCDEEITSYKELNVTDIALEDGQMKVTAASNDTQVTFEVTIYDLKNPSNIYSIEAAHCDPVVEETIICKQKLIIPSDRRPVKVLVSEIHKNGIVLKSSLSSFYFPDDKSTDTWIILVSVLGSIFGASLIVFAIVIAVKKKKSRKPKNTMGEKELSVLSEANRAAHRDSFFEDLDSRPLPKESPLYSRKRNAPQPPVKAPHRMSRKDDFPYSRKSDSPPPPVKAPHRMSRNDDFPYSRKPDSPPSARKSEGLPRKHYAPFSGNYNALLKGYDNKAYSSSHRPEVAPGRLPRIMPKLKPSNNRVPPSSEYFQEQSY